MNLIEELPDIAANLAALDVADATSDGRINLTHLNGSTGFILEGIDASDYSGRSVSAAGDGNGGTDTTVLGDAAGAVKEKLLARPSMNNALLFASDLV